MKSIELELPEDTADPAVSVSEAEFVRELERTERMLGLQRRRSEGRLRTVFAWYLLSAGTIILLVSLALIVHAALGLSHLGTAAVATLVGSVAVEFIGMLYLVVRYLFRDVV